MNQEESDMRKKLLSILLTLAMLLSLIPAGYAADIEIVDEPVGADAPGGPLDEIVDEPVGDGALDVPLAEGDIVASGQCGENLTWTLDDQGTLAIAGTGEMDNYSLPGNYWSPWDEYRSKIKSLEISMGVVSIGDNAFLGCNNLTEVSIPNSVIRIGNCAFVDCSSLCYVTIGQGVSIIGSSAFASCASLLEINIPANVSYIGDAVFSRCDSLHSVIVSENNERICVVDGLLYTDGLARLIYCPMWKEGEVTIPDGVTTIGTSAFELCEKITSVFIPDSVTTIGAQAFYYNTHLKEITLSSALNAINNSAFSGCSNLTRIDIPEGVSSIDNGAFYCCSSLARISLPKSLATIGGYAFFCKNLREVYYDGSDDDWNKISIDEGNNYLLSARSGNPILFEGVCGTDGDNVRWAIYNDDKIVIEGTGAMADYSFSEHSPWHNYRSYFESAVFLDNVTSIGAYSFIESNLASVSIPESVISIGEQAFLDNEALKSVTIPDSVCFMGSEVFGYCISLKNISLGTGLTSISEYTFYYCESLANILIPDEITSIGNNAFSNCDSLTEIRFEGNAPVFGVRCFDNVTATACYPANDPSWTEDVMQNYGGTITWVAYEPTPDGLPIDEEHFPDEAFRAYVAEKFDGDGNGYLNDEEIAAITEIDVSMMGISSLQGIEYFPELTVLLCLDNELTALDLSRNPKLEMLDCSFNSLTALDVTQNPALTSIDCSENAITALDVTNNPALEGLFCYGNEIAALDLSGNAALQVLDCSTNRLTALNLSGNPGLVILECYGNSIAELDLTPCPTLLDIVTNGTYEQKADYDSYSKDSYFVHVDPATTLITDEPLERFTITVTDYTKGKAQTSLDLTASYRDLVNFTVTSEGDRAVLVAIRQEDGLLSRVYCTDDENGEHQFSLIVYSDKELVIAFKGDVNLDGSLDLKDSLRVKKYVAGDAGQIGDQIQLLAGDVNADGSVNLKDLLAIKKAIAGSPFAW